MCLCRYAPACISELFKNLLESIVINLITQGSEDQVLYIFDEEDGRTLLLHRISPEDIYRKEEGSIFGFTDAIYR